MSRSDDPDSFAAAPVQDLRLYAVPAGFRGRSAVATQLWRLVQSTLFALSPQFLYGWRNWLLRRFGAQVGEGTIIRQSCRIYFPWKVRIGARCQIGDHVELYSLGPITIGDDVVISQQSYICTGSHDFTSPAFDIYQKPIVVESEAWIAARSFVHPGVTVRRGSVIAAGSIVKQDTEPYMVHGGMPLRPLYDRRTRRP